MFPFHVDLHLAACMRMPAGDKRSTAQIDVTATASALTKQTEAIRSSEE